jgi:hypothetical protein
MIALEPLYADTPATAVQFVQDGVIEIAAPGKFTAMAH